MGFRKIREGLNARHEGKNGEKKIPRAVRSGGEEQKEANLDQGLEKTKEKEGRWKIRLARGNGLEGQREKTIKTKLATVEAS